jgi:3'-phosphoadenosine 5'-phosphosulfate sulfotransferase (PAPS reductase)/FAD synthetase
MSLFDDLMGRRPGVSSLTEAQQVIQQDCPPGKGNAKKGRQILARFTQAAEAYSRSAPPPKYDPVLEYETIWRRGKSDSLRKMNGYRPGHHVGVVAELGQWQPNLHFFDLIVLNSSAGKDSMASMEAVTAAADAVGLRDRLVVIHSDLGRVEHPEVLAYARDQAESLGLPFHVVRREVNGVQKDLLQRFIENMQVRVVARTGDPVTILELYRAGFTPGDLRHNLNLDDPRQLSGIEARLQDLGMSATDRKSPGDGQYRVFISRGFPGFGTRYCTSEFKTAEISKWVTEWTKRWRWRNHEESRPARVLQVLGLRAEESDARAKPGFGWKKGATSNQHVYQWLPIQGMTTGEVWDVIAASAMTHHPAYNVGFERLSCRLCPLAGEQDVALAALVYPELTDEIVAIERKYGHKFKETRSLEEIRETALARPQLVQRAAQARRDLHQHLAEREKALGSLAVVGRQFAQAHGIQRCPTHG